MTFQQHYIENPLKMNSINLPTSEMMRNVSNTRPNSDPSYNLGGKPMLLQQNNPYVKSMLYDRENTYSEIINSKNALNSKSLYLNNNFQSSEAEAIDKIFEDLSYYEKTLEEMANAKLDNDFKEELAAIEQWFTVLSECERTTVLYSLIQNISELQIRFFLTLLQQKVKNNPLFNSFIKRPISDSVYSTSTKHCSNASSENSSMINSTSADTYYDDDDYQKNSFMDTNLPNNKTSTNQFACPLNMNEYNMAMNSLSNVNFLNERSSSLARPTTKNHSQAPHTSTPSSTTSSAASSRKNSYMNSMMNDYIKSTTSSPITTNPTSANLNVLRDMNRYNDSVLLNSMSNTSSPNQSRMNSQFLGKTQSNLMVNNNTSLYTNDSTPQRIPSFNNNTLLSQSAINTLINPNPLTLLNNNGNSPSNSTSALPVLSPTPSSLTLLGGNSHPTSPMISPIRPPKPSSSLNASTGVSSTVTNHSTTSPSTMTTITSPVISSKPNTQVTSSLESSIKEKSDKETTKSSGKILTEILINGKESKESKNASLLSNILTLSKEMNDMVNKNKERKKEKQAKSASSSPTTVTPPSKIKKSVSEDGESTILAPHSAESVVGANTNPSKEKGKIPDQIELDMLEDIPAFLRTLRLHKYAPAFDGLNWKQMIKLDNDELLRRGVSALGARNKMLKVFDLIKAEAQKQGVPLDS